MRSQILKTMAVSGLLAATLGSGWSAKAGEFTGSQSTSCQALLCLAAVGSAPSECMPALREYYSLDASSASRLRNKRKNFLNRCPSGTPDLVNSIVNGQCDEQGCSTPIVGGPRPQPRPPVDTIAR